MAFARTVTHTKTLISPSTGSADLVYGADYVSATSHTAAVSGATSGGIPYFDSATSEASSALLASGGVVLGGGAGGAPNTSANLTWAAATGQGLAMIAGTATTDVAAMSLTRTNNNAAVNTGILVTFTDTSSASTFTAEKILGGASGTLVLRQVGKSGGNYAPTIQSEGALSIYNTVANAIAQGSSGRLIYIGQGGAAEIGLTAGYRIAWSSGDPAISTDTALSRISAGLIGVGTGAAGSFAGRLKLTSAIAAAVAVASLNAAPTVGEVQSVNDALVPVVGNAVANGGAANALVWWNGAQWTVVAV